MKKRKHLQTTYQGLVSRIHILKTSKISSKKRKSTKRKWAQKMKVNEENIQMANKHMKRCLTSLAIRKMQVKPTIYNYIPIRMS